MVRDAHCRYDTRNTPTQTGLQSPGTQFLPGGRFLCNALLCNNLLGPDDGELAACAGNPGKSYLGSGVDGCTVQKRGAAVIGVKGMSANEVRGRYTRI